MQDPVQILIDELKHYADSAPATPPVLPQRVLVVEHDLECATVINESLSKQGCDVVTVDEPSKAVSAIHNTRPYDVVLMDLHFPSGASGISALRRIRAIMPEVPPTIIVSGFIREDFEKLAKELGFGICRKPFRLEELTAAIKEITASTTAP